MVKISKLPPGKAIGPTTCNGNRVGPTSLLSAIGNSYGTWLF
jgi:hypothetical protein